MTDPKAAADDWQHLKPFGYAPGNYMNECQWCHQIVEGIDKRAISCRPCAEIALAAASPALPEFTAIRQEIENHIEPKASPAPEPVAKVIHPANAYPFINPIIDVADLPKGTLLYTAPPADERVKTLEQRTETAEHDLQILTTVVRTGYPPPRAIPMRESAEGAARIAVERVERVKELEGLLRETLKEAYCLPEPLYTRIRAALGE